MCAGIQRANGDWGMFCKGRVALESETLEFLSFPKVCAIAY